VAICSRGISKIRTAGAGDVAQVEEHLLCKHEALSSNPMLTRKKEGKEGERGGLTSTPKVKRSSQGRAHKVS
jgi:hypothetical protein